MKISYRPHLNPLRPYRVDAREFYGLKKDVFKKDRWELSQEIQLWLESLPPRSFLGVFYDAVRFKPRSKNFYKSHGDMRMHFPVPSPDFMWFAKKSDILLFKMTWAGYAG